MYYNRCAGDQGEKDQYTKEHQRRPIRRVRRNGESNEYCINDWPASYIWYSGPTMPAAVIDASEILIEC